MDPDSRVGGAGLDLSSMPAPAKQPVRWPLAGAAVLCLTLVLGGTVILRDDAPEPPVAELPDLVTRQAPTPLMLAPAQALRDPSSLPVSRLIRQPVRLTDRNASGHDLQAQTRQVLAGFGHVAVPDDRLQQLLIYTLAQGQSDAYIDVALNAAAARGEFTVPASLRTLSGGLDTARLLAAFLKEAAG